MSQERDMAVRWTVLASGSSGNASLLETCDGALLVDCGLGPRATATRLSAVGMSWSGIRAVVLTHTHADHWHDKTLARLNDLQIPLFCHPDHQRELQLRCEGFQDLQFAGLVRSYEGAREFSPFGDVRCRPVSVPHDGGPTFGFRLEGGGGLFDAPWAIGYAADLGSWTGDLAKSLANVDILALEFNHDVEMQRASRRAPWLIERVLGDHGHLSNLQGAQLLHECLRRSTRRAIRHVIQLHLSRECNRPPLATTAARRVLPSSGVDLHTAEQHRVGPILAVGQSGAVLPQSVLEQSRVA